jgi:Flp pilus assembly protein TadG
MTSRATYPIRRKSRGESGQALVEFAVVLPILALLVIGLIQMGLAFYNYLTLTDAVRTAARAAAVAPAASACSTANAVVHNQLSGAVVSCPPSFTPGASFTITATYDSPIDILGIVVSPGHLSSSSTERKEG